MARETIDALLAPSLKVSRPVSACKKCRSAKIKCDGKLPSCTACERAGKAEECSSANDDFARGKERSYVSALELAVQRLQRRIEERNSQSTIAGRPGLVRKPVSQTRRKEATSVDALVEDLSFLALNATSRDFQGFAATMSFARMLKAIAVKQDLPEARDPTLPPRHSISQLIDQYFDHVHVMSPFLSETEFHSAVSRVYSTNQSDQNLPFDQWCFRLVLATASASLCQVKGDEHYRNAMHHASIAMESIEHVIHPGSIAGIQALLLLTQYSLVDPEHFDGWYLVGMAARLCVDLGLHCEPAPEIKISKHALDQRRRIFYCAYALDRLIAMSLGYAFSFTDDSAPNVLLPTLATDQEARSPSQLFTRSIRPSLFLFDVRRVQSSYYQSKNCSSRKEWTVEATQNYITSTLEDVNSWHSTLSSSFSEAVLQMFYLEYLYTQVLVLSPSTVSPVSILPDSTRYNFFNTAVQYAQQLCSMLRRQDLQSCLNYADFCRARSIAKHFQSIMWGNFDGMIRSSALGQPSSPLANCNRALGFLSNMSQILESARAKWDNASLKISFDRESAVLLARLQTRQQEYANQPTGVINYTSQPNTDSAYMQQFDLSMTNNMQAYNDQQGPTSLQRYGSQQNSQHDATTYSQQQQPQGDGMSMHTNQQNSRHNSLQDYNSQPISRHNSLQDYNIQQSRHNSMQDYNNQQSRHNSMQEQVNQQISRSNTEMLPNVQSSHTNNMLAYTHHQRVSSDLQPFNYQQPMSNDMQAYGNQGAPSKNQPTHSNQRPMQNSSTGLFSDQQTSPAFSQGPHHAILPPPISNNHYAHPAVHRSNLVQASEWNENAEHNNSKLPSGTLPRRNYHFTGGPS